MSAYAFRPSYARASASLPGRPAHSRPVVQRWASEPVAKKSSGMLDIPSQEAANAYKAWMVRTPLDFLTHSSDIMREELLLAFIKASAHFGASPNALEDMMLDASRTLDVKVTIVRKAGVVTCLVGNRMGSRRYIRVVSPLVRLSYFFGLVEVRRIYEAVVEKRVRVPDAQKALAELCSKPPMHNPVAHLIIASVISGLLCAFVFGGLSHNVLITVVATIALCMAHYFLRKGNIMSAELFELLVTITISLYAHDFRNAPAISILSGYLYFSSALKRSNKYSRTEPVVAGFAAMYTVTLKFGLPIVLDLFMMNKLFALVILVKKMWSLPVYRAVPTTSLV